MAMDEQIAGAGVMKWIGVLPVALTTAGLLLYGSLTIAIIHFYEELNTSPSDVGLGYLNTIAKSTGFVVLFALVILPPLALALYFRPYWYLFTRMFDVGIQEMTDTMSQRAVDKYMSERMVSDGEQRSSLSQEEMERILQRSMQRIVPDLARQTFQQLFARGILITGLALVVLFTVAVIVLSSLAGARAHSVQTGHEVSPVRLFGPGLTILPVQADRAVVSWNKTDGMSPSIPKTLLYLGSSNGTSIFYDPEHKSALRLPSASITTAVQ
jgi:hypothetical protein